MPCQQEKTEKISWDQQGLQSRRQKGLCVVMAGSGVGLEVALLGSSSARAEVEAQGN